MRLLLADAARLRCRRHQDHTSTQIHYGRAVPANAKSLQPGDLVFTEGSAVRPEHVAMAIGDGLLVHAPRPGRVVEVATHGTILVVRRIV